MIHCHLLVCYLHFHIRYGVMITIYIYIYDAVVSNIMRPVNVLI